MVLGFLLAGALAMALLPSPCWGAAVSIRAKTILVGATFTADVYVGDVTDLYGAAFDLLYPPAGLEVVDSDAGQPGVQPQALGAGLLEAGDPGAATLACALQNGEPGRLVVGYSRRGDAQGIDVAGSALLLQIGFRALQEGTYALDFDLQALLGADGQVLPATWSPGAIEVSRDDDGDALPDTWEVRYFGDLAQVPGGDYDGDGETNGEEQVNGTDPVDARSAFAPGRAYAGFLFQIRREARQTAGKALVEDRWGLLLECRMPGGGVFQSGTLTKPAGSTGTSPVALAVGATPDMGRFERADYASLAALTTDAAPGQYQVVCWFAVGGGAPQRLSFRLDVSAYNAAAFPASVLVEQPAPGASNASLAPLLDFDRPDWHDLAIRAAGGGATVYTHQRTVTETDTHRPATAVLTAGTQYELVVAAYNPAASWLATWTRSAFATAPIPVVTAFAINNGAATTRHQTVTLNNTCTGSPVSYMASERSDFADATLTAYATAPSFLLSDGDGPKTVHFMVWNAVGVSAAVSDTITLDTSAPEVVPPNGPFMAVTDAAAVAAGRGFWDLTGAYATTAAGHPLVLSLVHDTKGKLTGNATYRPAGAPVANIPVKGTAKGAAGNVLVKIALKGADPTKVVSVSLTMNLTLNAAARQLSGPMTGSVTIAGVTTPVSASIALPVAAPMDGTWTLRFVLAQGLKGITGTAKLTLSNGVDYDYVVKGKAAGQTAVLSLAGAPTDPAAKGIKIKTTITPYEDELATLNAFAGKGYGQTVAW